MEIPDLKAVFQLAGDIAGKRAHGFAHDGFTDRATAEIAYIMQELGLPVPDSRSYVSSNDGALLFMNDYGCVVRIENEGVRLEDDVSQNPFVQQPLGRIKGRFVTVEICPGGKAGATSNDIFWLQDRLQESNLALDDNDLDARNAIMLPYTDEDWPRGMPVICDRSAVQREQTYRPPRDDTAERFALVQEELYGDLQDLFAQAWRARDFAADHGSMIDFWQACRDKAAEGVLVAGWNGGGKGDRHLHRDNAASAASYYQQRLEAHPPEEPHFEREHKSPAAFADLLILHI